MFPQMAAPQLAPADWEPHFVDYLYLSFTNATAFSPTDVMPLARWAKLTMLVQSAVSLAVGALVIARAVNILKSVGIYSQGMPKIATADRVDRNQLIDFIRDRHRVTLVTRRRDGRPQISPVTAGVDDGQRIVISTYPDRAKAVNFRRDPAASVLVHSDPWDGPYVQVDGTAERLDTPSAAAVDVLADYFRCIAGEHPAWTEYREAMRRHGKSLIRITIDGWGPIATGGFPADRGIRRLIARGPSARQNHLAAEGWPAVMVVPVVMVPVAAGIGSPVAARAAAEPRHRKDERRGGYQEKHQDCLQEREEEESGPVKDQDGEKQEQRQWQDPWPAPVPIDGAGRPVTAAGRPAGQRAPARGGRPSQRAVPRWSSRPVRPRFAHPALRR